MGQRKGIRVSIRVPSRSHVEALAHVFKAAASSEQDEELAALWMQQYHTLVERKWGGTSGMRWAYAEDIDAEAVERVVRGVRPLPKLTREEARRACWEMENNSFTPREIQSRLHTVSLRTVYRWRKDNPSRKKPQ